MNFEPTTNVRKDDRVLVLEPIPGDKVKSSKGDYDPRLFSGENKLHAIRDPDTNLWFLKYDKGGLPEPLKQRFTNFQSTKEYVERYFQRRGLQISRIED